MIFSIIIPSYNQNLYLNEAIQSALNQKVSPRDKKFGFEVIIVDDGSTDGSLETAKKYEKDGVVVISQVNKGLASARNTAIMNAVGDYIVPLDADDMLIEDCLSRVYNRLLKNPVDIVGLSFRCMGLSTQPVILGIPRVEDFRLGNRLGYCAAIKRGCLLEVGGYSPRMTWGYEDLHLWINLLSRGATVDVIQEVCWLYRIKAESMITDAKSHHAELLAQINKDFPSININFPA